MGAKSKKPTGAVRGADEPEARTPLAVRTLPNPLREREALVSTLTRRWRQFESWPVEEQLRERARICSTILPQGLAPEELAEILWAVLALSARGVRAREYLVRAASGEIEFLRREAEIRKRGENPTFDRVLAEPAGEGPGYIGDAPTLHRACRGFSIGALWGGGQEMHRKIARSLVPALLGRPRRGLHPSLYSSQVAAVKEKSALLKNADRLIKGLSETEAEKKIREKVWAYWRREAKPEPLDRERDFDRWTSLVPLRALGVDGDDPIGGAIETAHLVQLVSAARRWRPGRRGLVAWDLVAFAETRSKWAAASLKTRAGFDEVLKDARREWEPLGVNARRRR